MNVYNKGKDREEYLRKYFTLEGQKALEARLNSLALEYVKELKYPVSLNMLGFPALIIHSKNHHEGMMENLRQILGLQHVEVEEVRE